MMINECTKPEKKVSPEDYNGEYGPLRWRPGAELDHGMHIGRELRDNPDQVRNVDYTVQWILRGIAHGLKSWNKDEPKSETAMLHLDVLRQARLTVERETAEAVADARARELSWAQIGTALGMTRQAAQQKYGCKND
jgi:hypothetical protein